MKSLICAFTGRHKWSAEVSPTADFQRIDCLRCGEAIDGARVRLILARLPLDHWMRNRLPSEQQP